MTHGGGVLDALVQGALGIVLFALVRVAASPVATLPLAAALFVCYRMAAGWKLVPQSADAHKLSLILISLFRKSLNSSITSGWASHQSI